MSNSSKIYKHLLYTNQFGVADKIKEARKDPRKNNRKGGKRR